MQSTLKYVAESPEDFGTISCEASNSVGRQSVGCKTTLVSVGEWALRPSSFQWVSGLQDHARVSG